MSTMENWIRTRLSKLMQFAVPDDLVQYLMSIENNRDAEDYLATLLDFSNPEHKLFLIDLISKRNEVKKPNLKLKQNQGNVKKGSSIKTSSEDSTGAKKKTKFVNLYSPEGQSRDVILLKGRHHCDCEASKHDLINNCLKCGRIVCAQEGSGPCLFCGELVCSNEEKNVLRQNTDRSDSLLNRLKDQKRPKGWEQALLQRNKLVEYDKNSEQRTRVIDDESDYFNSTSVWLTKSEKAQIEKFAKEMHEKKHKSRANKSIILDFAGRTVTESKQADTEYDQTVLRELIQASDKYVMAQSDVSRPALNPNLEIEPPMIMETERPLCNTKSFDNDGLSMRLQDKDIQEMSDRGVCLSMHQPYASLLVENIKRHEGRSWYTAHRGRLWIASTAKIVDMEEVKSVENFYRKHYENSDLKFPAQYPSGCLLGHVTVSECFSQEEYQKIYPNGESESPYVFICTNPEALPIKFPIKGQHKIYKLDPKIHQAALKTIRKV
ncbi:activating signal cointegrator 1 [Ctenocephalides felis]|uniref:activating signal cointegrator 1 n=1 Tax=Ctenocephalides felis TaxID=7515 RepID=UPI000E6E341E|nr:activating signal cointegrator 1 [Ctenocephalides felis]